MKMERNHILDMANETNKSRNMRKKERKMAMTLKRIKMRKINLNK